MRTFNLGYFLLGLFFIFVSLLSFRNPGGNLVALVYVFAFLAIFKGVMELGFRSRLEGFTENKHRFLFLIGIVDILLGVFLLFNVSVGLIALPFIFAIWFIFDSLSELVVVDSYKAISTGYYWFSIILNCLCVIIGISLFFNPVTAAFTLAFLVGFYFMMTGISYIIAAF
jgi:uncharacterized membrane protein HdeD (DUF308 family)